MQHFVDQGQFAGAVTVVGRKEAILSFEAVGRLNIEKNAPMSKDAIFQIASMTKPITAIGIMQLQEAGKLNIDDLVAERLPEFQGQTLVAERNRIATPRETKPPDHHQGPERIRPACQGNTPAALAISS